MASRSSDQSHGKKRKKKEIDLDEGRKRKRSNAKSKAVPVKVGNAVIDFAPNEFLASGSQQMSIKDYFNRKAQRSPKECSKTPLKTDRKSPFLIIITHSAVCTGLLLLTFSLFCSCCCFDKGGNLPSF